MRAGITSEAFSLEEVEEWATRTSDPVFLSAISAHSSLLEVTFPWAEDARSFTPAEWHACVPGENKPAGTSKLQRGFATLKITSAFLSAEKVQWNTKSLIELATCSLFRSSRML